MIKNVVNYTDLIIYLLGVAFLGFFNQEVAKMNALVSVIFCLVYLCGVRYIGQAAKGYLQANSGDKTLT